MALASIHGPGASTGCSTPKNPLKHSSASANASAMGYLPAYLTYLAYLAYLRLPADTAAAALDVLSPLQLRTTPPGLLDARGVRGFSLPLRHLFLGPSQTSGALQSASNLHGSLAVPLNRKQAKANPLRSQRQQQQQPQ